MDVLGVIRLEGTIVRLVEQDENGHDLTFLYFSLTTAQGDAIIIRVQGRLAQLVRALR